MVRDLEQKEQDLTAAVISSCQTAICCWRVVSVWPCFSYPLVSVLFLSVAVDAFLQVKPSDVVNLLAHRWCLTAGKNIVFSHTTLTPEHNLPVMGLNQQPWRGNFKVVMGIVNVLCIARLFVSVVVVLTC